MPYRRHSHFSPEIITVIVVIMIVIFIASYFYSKKAIVRRTLKKAPHRPLQHFKEGETAKVIGRIECVNEPLTAPLSGRKCAHYHVVVEEKVSTGKNSHWRTIIEKDASNIFVIRDGAYCAYIEDTTLKSYIVDDANYNSGLFNDPDGHLAAYLKKHGYDSENWLGFNKTIRYSEGILEPGEEVAVLGTGRWLRAAEMGVPEHYGTILVISSEDRRSVYLSDDPNTVQKKFSI